MNITTSGSFETGPNGLQISANTGKTFLLTKCMHVGHDYVPNAISLCKLILSYDGIFLILFRLVKRVVGVEGDSITPVGVGGALTEPRVLR